MKKQLYKFLSIFGICTLLLMPSLGFAQSTVPVTNNNSTVPKFSDPERTDFDPATTRGGIGNALVGLDTTAKTANIKTSNTDITTLVSRGISILLGFVGIIFMVLIIYGGILWMTAGGDENKVRDARKIMTNATIGLVAILAAYILTVFIVESIINVVT
jgi:hypothetical protein